MELDYLMGCHCQEGARGKLKNDTVMYMSLCISLGRRSDGYDGDYGRAIYESRSDLQGKMEMVRIGTGK
jgi:hypothetical protein